MKLKVSGRTLQTTFGPYMMASGSGGGSGGPPKPPKAPTRPPYWPPGWWESFVAWLKSKLGK